MIGAVGVSQKDGITVTSSEYYRNVFLLQNMKSLTINFHIEREFVKY